MNGMKIVVKSTLPDGTRITKVIWLDNFANDLGAIVDEFSKFVENLPGISIDLAIPEKPNKPSKQTWDRDWETK